MKYISNPKVKLLDEISQLYPNTSQFDYAVQSSIAYTVSKRDFIMYNKRSERAGLNRWLNKVGIKMLPDVVQFCPFMIHHHKMMTPTTSHVRCIILDVDVEMIDIKMNDMLKIDPDFTVPIEYTVKDACDLWDKLINTYKSSQKAILKKAA